MQLLPRDAADDARHARRDPAACGQVRRPRYRVPLPGAPAVDLPDDDGGLGSEEPQAHVAARVQLAVCRIGARARARGGDGGEVGMEVVDGGGK